MDLHEEEAKKARISNYISTTQKIDNSKKLKREAIKSKVEENRKEYIQRKEKHALEFIKRKEEVKNKIQKYAEILEEKQCRQKNDFGIYVIKK